MSAIRIERHPGGPQFHVGRGHLHHGLDGCALTAVGAFVAFVAPASPVGPFLAGVGAALAWHDRADWRDWLRDLRAG